MTLQPFAVAPVVGLVATLGAAGFALQNATPNILSWTAPNDGQLHRFLMFATQDVSLAQTGGLVTIQYFAPDGTSGGPHTVFPGGSGAGETQPSSTYAKMIQAGTTVLVKQGSALTVGAATVWAEIWWS